MRLDLYLVGNSYADSRQKAQRLIKSGCVRIDGIAVTKPSEEIDGEHFVEITECENEKYVSRGGLKLEGALRAFGIDPKGMVCADIGASTGGFTDCLLQSGAAKVYAFDSGKSQLHERLASDERVVSREGFNARYITLDDVGEAVDLAVMDVSFISQTLIIPNLSKLIKKGGRFVTLIKPQFEAGRTALGKNGIVKRKEDRLSAVLRVLECAAENFLSFGGLIPSPIKGGDGNEEFLAVFILSDREDIVLPSPREIKDTVYGTSIER
jgi:23S rRNA (cytidine1920-2'-O)/16S rRNA (cytidine1409-2'-O)-methyltransferase